MENIGYIAGQIIGIGLLTRLTNTYVFHSLGYINRSLLTFIIFTILCIAGELFLGIVGTVLFLIYDLIKGAIDNKSVKQSSTDLNR